jgi:hypothetical protein
MTLATPLRRTWWAPRPKTSPPWPWLLSRYLCCGSSHVCCLVELVGSRELVLLQLLPLLGKSVTVSIGRGEW